MQSNEKYRQILAIINQSVSLPSPPAIAVKILNTVKKDEADLSELGDIISSDPALTAKMLKVANSGIFSRNGNISNIGRAMTALGTNLIKNIALSFIIAENFSSGCQQEFDMDTFWRRSITAAVAAEMIAKQIGYTDDDIFVAAILQDIGTLIIALTNGEEYNKLLQESQNTGTDIWALESDKFGFNHLQVGYALLSNWNLPASITEPILYHHRPEDCTPESSTSAKILKYSNQLADIYNLNEVAEKARILQNELVENFEFTVDQACRLLDEAAINSKEMLLNFELEEGQIRPYSAMLQEANAALGQLHLSNEQMLLEMTDAKQKAERLAAELQDANARLKELVYRDGLTGLYNHRFFQESLENELARAKRYQTSVSLIMFDVDHFKKVNDSHGHPAGDLVLMNISRAVSSAVRPSDIVARYGGEEFAVILPETSAAGAKVFAARLRRCVEGIATLVEGQLIYVTISAGTTTFSNSSGQVSKNILIETADRCLYAAKQSGRNQVIALDPEMATDHH